MPVEKKNKTRQTRCRSVNKQFVSRLENAVSLREASQLLSASGDQCVTARRCNSVEVRLFCDLSTSTSKASTTRAAGLQAMRGLIS